jgi:winged helix DNA-binding protein
MGSPLDLTREQILGFRRRAGALDDRLPAGRRSLQQAAWAGLQDSMPRAAVLSIHARVEEAGPMVWEDPTFIQIWGPRYSAYVIAARDLAVFTLGRYPDDARGRRRADDTARSLHAAIGDARVRYGDAGAALGVNANALRYATTTGTVLIRWDGARQPVIWTVPPPGIDPLDARLELARRYLHVFGPATPASFSEWAGIATRAGAAAFEALAPSLVEVRTPIGEGWVLASDEAGFRAGAGSTARARLLPSGDAYYLLQGAHRELLVPDTSRRDLLWTPRVWPGAVLLEGEVRGVWRRAHHVVTVEPWGGVSRAERDAVEAEAAGMPLPGVEGRIAVRWSDG